MKKEVLLLATMSLFTLGCYAQKVYKDNEGKFILEAAGLPVGSYTRTLKPRTTDGTISAPGTNTPANIGSAVNNETISYRFEIAASDHSTRTDWVSAVNLCAGLSSGGNWRLPTQRELQLVHIMHDKLKTFAGFTPFESTNYWTASEQTGDQAVYVHFPNNYTNFYTKTSSNHARCIRDF